MLPFLKRKDESSMAIKDEDEGTIGRKSDYGEDDTEDGMLDAIAEDMLNAVSKKDKGLMKESLDALCEYFRDEIEGPQESDLENQPLA